MGVKKGPPPWLGESEFTFPLGKGTPALSVASLPTVRRAIPSTLYQGISGFFRWQGFVFLGNFAYGKAVAIMVKNHMGKFVSHDAVDPGLGLSFKPPGIPEMETNLPFSK